MKYEEIPLEDTSAESTDKASAAVAAQLGITQRGPLTAEEIAAEKARRAEARKQAA